MLNNIALIRNAKTGRASSWNQTGANGDCWKIPAQSSVVLADIAGPGCITHIWMTQIDGYRECLLRITFDDAPGPSVLCPLGDFFCVGHGKPQTFQNYFFTASKCDDPRFLTGCALNCYLPMPFRRRAVVELINESEKPRNQFFYIDYETHDDLPDNAAYLHAEFRRVNPFGGWGGDATLIETGKAINKEEKAWRDNYVILDAKGRGHYIGCNLSVTNFFDPPDGDNWWGEGDDMIWVDGYKWPPDLHGTGTEDYFNQAWGTQPSAFLRNGSSYFEPGRTSFHGGLHTYYVFHVENPVHFRESIKVTIEHGHANSLRNDYCSVAYWYASEPTPVRDCPPLAKRLPIPRTDFGKFITDPDAALPGKEIERG